MSRKEDWEVRYRKIKEHYPSVEDFKWSGALDYDPDVFTQVMNDLLKAEGKRSRPGKRPTLSRDVAENELAKLSGADFSEYPFGRALQALISALPPEVQTYRSLSARTGCNKDYLVKYVKGTLLPSFSDIEKIAASFNKDPSYFLEYRTAYVLMAVDKYLMGNPEIATVWHLKLKGRPKLKVK